MLELCRDGRWEHALSLLGTSSDDVALAAAISACEKGWQWRRTIVGNPAAKKI